MTENELIVIMKDRYEYRDGGLYVKRQYHYSVRVGQRAGKTHIDGYRQIKICGALYKEHRLIWLLHNKAWPIWQIDHINHEKQDNRIENLRDVTQNINKQNQIHANKDNKLGVQGVCFDKASGKFRAQISADKKKIYVGLFDTIEEASRSYLCAKEKYHAGAVLFSTSVNDAKIGESK